MTCAWWTSRSIVAAATTSSPRVSPQREKMRFDVKIMVPVSYLDATNWKNNDADAASNGKYPTSSTTRTRYRLSRLSSAASRLSSWASANRLIQFVAESNATG